MGLSCGVAGVEAKTRSRVAPDCPRHMPAPPAPSRSSRSDRRTEISLHTLSSSEVLSSAAAPPCHLASVYVNFTQGFMVQWIGSTLRDLKHQLHAREEDSERCLSSQAKSKAG